MKKIFLFYSLMLYLPLLMANTLHIAAFNIQASDANDRIIAQQISSFTKMDIWAVEESTNQYATTILTQLNTHPNAHFSSLLGHSGQNMRLQLFYNQNKLTLLDSFELDKMNPQNRVRSPLVALFTQKNEQTPFYVMVNHLYRSNSKARQKQARQINAWAQTQSYPIIAVGDYNFDLNPKHPNQHDKGFDQLLANHVFTWAKPLTLIPTQCSTHQSILDFIFISSSIKNWLIESKILFPESTYCPDDHNTSDHRPITASFNLNPASA